ncbi:hypothetical protein ACTXT7_014041 [Hymenolepis weldensis]
MGALEKAGNVRKKEESQDHAQVTLTEVKQLQQLLRPSRKKTEVLQFNDCLMLDAKCKPTFRQVTSSLYRDRNGGQTIVKHHWVLRKQQENRCQACKKWIQTKFTFRNNIALPRQVLKTS